MGISKGFGNIDELVEVSSLSFPCVTLYVASHFWSVVLNCRTSFGFASRVVVKH